MAENFNGWRKSSRSNGQNGNCVEVGFADDSRGIRDTKEAGSPSRSTLAVSGAAFTSFLNTVKSGQLDL